MDNKELISVTTASFSLNFPETKSDEIVRSNLTHTIDLLLDSMNNDLVFVDGPEGIGKTTLLKQFCENHTGYSFSCFLNPFNAIGYNEYSIIYDLYNQVYWFLNNIESPDKVQVGIEDLRFIILELKKKKSRLKKTIYFIIDGLETNNNPDLIKWVFTILPIKESGFKFIITGSSKAYAEHYQFLSKIRYQDYIVSPFSFEETEKFLLKDINRQLDQQSIRSLFNASSNGAPGKLANLKRHLIRSGKSVDGLLDSVESLNEIFELEWERLKEVNNTLLTDIVAIISIDSKLIKIDTLSEILSVSENDLKSAISVFDSIYVNSRNELQFYSSSQKKFFAKKFEFRTDEILHRIINYYSNKKEDSIDALLNLPNYYESINRWGDVLECLSGDYLPKVVRASQSLVLISQKVNQGYSAAKKLENDQIVKFALQGSLIQNIEGLHTWRSEIEARISLGEYERAITLAEGALLKEDRLRLILKISKAKVKKGLPLDEGLIDLVKKLYSEVNFSGLGEKAFEIAADLFYTIPQLAIELLQNTSATTDLQSLNERILTKITVSAFENKSGYDEDKLNFLEKNSNAESLSNSIAFLIRKYSAEQMLFEAEKIQETKSKIYLTKVWVDFNQTDKSLASVLEYSLTKCQELSSFELLDSEVLKSLSRPLFNVENTEVRDILIKRFRSFDQDLKRVYPTIDFVEHELNLIRSEISIDYNSAIGKFIKLKDEILASRDIVTRGDSLAIAYSSILEMKSIIEERHQFVFEQLESALKNVVSEITKVTAEHYENLKNMIRILSGNAPLLAFELSNKAYTLYRKENLIVNLIDEHLEADQAKIDMALVSKFYKFLTIKYNKDFALYLIISSFSNRDKTAKNKIPHLIKYLGEVRLIDSLALKCKVIVSFLRIISPHDEYISLYGELRKQLIANWQNINSEIDQIEIGFLIADDISDYDSSLAQEFLGFCDEIKNRLWIDSLNTSYVYFELIYLMIKVFSGLIKLQKFDEAHVRRLLHLIQRVPSNTQRISLHSYLAHQFYSKNDLANAYKIIEENLRTAIDSSQDTYERSIMIRHCCDLLFVNNQLLTMRLIDELPYEHREGCLAAILNFILTKQIPTEPYSGDVDIEEIDFSKISNACMLVEKLQSDYQIYEYIELIVRILSKGKLYSKVQKNQIYNDLMSIIDKKLPAFDGVPHTGYKIVASAQLIRLMEKDKHKSEFTKLVQQVGAVNNKSDQSFIYSILFDIASHLALSPNSKQELLQKSLSILDELNCDMEFVARITNISAIISKSLKNFPMDCKEKIKVGFKKAFVINNDSLLANQQRLLDISYRIDKNFAKTLCSLIDDDESRRNARRRAKLKDHIAILETQTSIANEGRVNVKESERRILSTACYKSLAELNSGLLVTKKPANLLYLFDTAHKTPIAESFPIFSYYFQNLVNRLEQSVESSTIIPPILDSMHMLCLTIETLSDRHKSKNAKFTEKKLDILNDNKVIRPGERDVALAYLREWMRENLDEYVKICDPYFNTDELSIVKTILEINPSVLVEILTSVQPYKEDSLAMDMNQAWLDQWRLISTQDPPHTKINVVITKNSKKTPFHDRWIVTKNAGLRLGTSLNSIGVTKESEISIMHRNQKDEVEKEILDQYLSFKILTHKNEKLLYKTILLN